MDFDFGYWLPYILGAIIIAAVAFSIIVAFTAPAGVVKLSRAPQEDSDDSRSGLVLGDMTKAMSQQLPGRTRDQEQVLPQLKRAGYYRPTALVEFQAMRTMLVLVPLVASIGIALFVAKPLIPGVLGAGLVLAVLGFAIPRIYLAVRANQRAAEIERGLPLFADLLALALMSGQSLTAAMRRVTDQIRTAFPGLAEELEIVIRQTEMLNLSAAFEQWADRSQVPDVRNLATILTQSQKLGNEPSQVLLEYATNIRVNLRQRADAHAQRTGFWMLFPSIFCMWTPALVLLVAPVFFEFNKQIGQSREALNDYNTINSPQTGMPVPQRNVVLPVN
jgi:tight adherence protein C